MRSDIPIVSFDTSAHNRLVKDGACSEAVMAGIKSRFFFRFAALSIEELVATPDVALREAFFFRSWRPRRGKISNTAKRATNRRSASRVYTYRKYSPSMGRNLRPRYGNPSPGSKVPTRLSYGRWVSGSMIVALTLMPTKPPSSSSWMRARRSGRWSMRC